MLFYDVEIRTGSLEVRERTHRGRLLRREQHREMPLRMSLVWDPRKEVIKGGGANRASQR